MMRRCGKRSQACCNQLTLVAGELGVSEITAKVHRGNVMKKMGARSLADLVRMADAFGIRQAKH
jgi:FixJ family two-component response regulator